MAVYDVSFYGINPSGLFSTVIGGTTVYTGPGGPAGLATITDSETGIQETTLDDDDSSGTEAATATVTLGGNTSTGSPVDAELVWTLRDTVTGETFQIVQFDVETGAAAGDYLLSETPLVAGRTYVTEGYDTLPDVLAGDPVFTQTDYVPDLDGTVEGTAGNDVIDTSYTGDPQGDRIDNSDNIVGQTTTAETLSWTAFGGFGTDISAGLSAAIGGVSVSVSFADDGAASGFEVDTFAQYVGAGETFDANSALYLAGDGSGGETSTTTLDFGAASGGGKEDYVRDVNFRINDIDGDIGNWLDVVTVTAIGPDGNPVSVTITIDGNDALSGSTITASSATLDDPADQAGSAFVHIEGPVTRVLIDYDNGGGGGQFINVSDVNFFTVDAYGDQDDVVDAGAGDDFIDPSLGNDLVDGGLGDDTIVASAGDDTLTGGAGDDTFVYTVGAGMDTITDFGAGNTGSIYDGDQTNNDLVDLSSFYNPASLAAYNAANGALGDIAFEINLLRADAADGTLDGIVNGVDISGATGAIDLTLLNGGAPVTGSALSFDNTNVICFAAGTRIETLTGLVAVENLQDVALIRTLDHGYRPIRWIGSRSVQGEGKLAPIQIEAGVLGNHARLVVSPQHRMLVTGAIAEAMFGQPEVLVPAKHLLGWGGVSQVEVAEVTYFHLLFDRHEIIYAEGAAAESFHPGAVGMSSMELAVREEIFEIFPQLRVGFAAYGPLARPSLTASEARSLVERGGVDAYAGAL